MTSVRHVSVLVLLFLVIAPAATYAQVLSPKDGPIVYGHYHLNVGNIEEHKRFWIEALGGIPANVEGFPGDVVKFSRVLVMLRQQKATGGMKGTTVGPLGFQVPGLQAMVGRLKELRYPVTMGETSATVIGPEQMVIELVENKGLTTPIALHRVQLVTPDVAATQAWYSKVFGAKPGKNGTFETAMLPGVILTFIKAEGPVAPTSGRVVNHIGFEIENLRAFVDGLDAMGAKPGRPYTQFGPFKLGFVFITDPWGTDIELNEGLARIFP